MTDYKKLSDEYFEIELEGLNSRIEFYEKYKTEFEADPPEEQGQLVAYTETLASIVVAKHELEGKTEWVIAKLYHLENCFEDYDEPEDESLFDNASYNLILLLQALILFERKKLRKAYSLMKVIDTYANPDLKNKHIPFLRAMFREEYRKKLSSSIATATALIGLMLYLIVKVFDFPDSLSIIGNSALVILVSSLLLSLYSWACKQKLEALKSNHREETKDDNFASMH